MLTTHTAAQYVKPAQWTVVYQRPGGHTYWEAGSEEHVMRRWRYLIIDQYHAFLFDDQGALQRKNIPYELSIRIEETS